MPKTATMLVGAVASLLTLGIVMLFSTSTAHGEALYDAPFHFVHRQLLWMVIGLVAAFCGARVPYRTWSRWAIPVALVSLFLLFLVFVAGTTVKGSTRWLRFGPFSLQPSETAKFAVIVILAWWMSRVRRHADDLVQGAIIPLALMGPFLGFIFLEPDYGTTLLIGMTGLALLFAGQACIAHLAVAGVLGLGGLTAAVMHNPQRMRRILAFLHPQRYARDEAFQLLMALLAFVIGGGRGAGLGESLQKLHYLPEPHTDFIFAIIGEELGLTASLGVVVLFLTLFLCGWRISIRAPDAFGRLLAFGITLVISLQAAMNIAVVSGSIPTKGIPLPFISFGGSSLVVSLFMIGVLVNIDLSSGSPPSLRSNGSAHRNHPLKRR